MVCSAEDESKKENPNEKCCLCVNRKWCCILSLKFFVFLLIVGILMLALVPYLIHVKIKSTITLGNPRAGLYQTFRNSSAQGVVIENIYKFFNITNVEDVEKHGKDPIVEEVGPCYYRHVKSHPESEIRWKANGTMEYKKLQTNLFMAEKSGSRCREDMVINTPRMGIFVALQQGGGDAVMQGLIMDALNKENVTSLFQQRSIHELIAGYDEPVLKWLRSHLKVVEFLHLIPYVQDLIAFDQNITNPDTVKPMAIYAGNPVAKNKPTPPEDSFGTYTMVNGLGELPYWKSKAANKIEGTDATYYPPLIMLKNKDVRLKAYVSDISRVINLDFTHRHTIDGITVHRYRLDKNMFYDDRIIPANGDYFITHTGFQPITPCKGVPEDYIFAAISKAYYLDCNMTDVNVVMPRKPNRAIDDIELDYEPITSTLIEGNKRLQINVRLRKNVKLNVKGKLEIVEATKNLPETWMPIFATNEHGTLPEKDRKKLKDGVIDVILAMLVCGIIAVVFGVFGSAYTGYKVYVLTKAADVEEENQRANLLQSGGSMATRYDSDVRINRSHNSGNLGSHQV